jgi:hypothetical protein
MTRLSGRLRRAHCCMVTQDEQHEGRTLRKKPLPVGEQLPEAPLPPGEGLG